MVPILLAIIIGLLLCLRKTTALAQMTSEHLKSARKLAGEKSDKLLESQVEFNMTLSRAEGQIAALEQLLAVANAKMRVHQGDDGDQNGGVLPKELHDVGADNES